MNVAKNWALTTMQTTLAFAHFSSKLLLKEQMIIPVKKTLNNAGHIDAKLIDFSEICQKKPSEIGCFLLIVSWRSFPVKSADFSMNLPLKILRNLTFSAKMPRNRSIFLRILTFLPRNRRIFPRILTFSRKNPTKSANFSANFDFFPAKIPRNRPIFPRICP